MSEEEVYKKIEQIYSTEKGRGFITHLLRSYFPVGKGEYIWDQQKDTKCAITGVNLVGKADIFVAMNDVKPEEITEQLLSRLDLSGEEKPVENPILKRLPKNSVLGVESPESDKKLSVIAFQQLYNFYCTRLLSDDKHISWLAKNMRAKETISSARNNGVDITKTEEKVILKKVNKPKTTTFGDLAVLQQLKEKLEKEEQTK